MATLILEHSDLAGSDRLGQTLRDHGQRLRVVRVHRGEPIPADLDDVDAVVSCGGGMSPFDDRQSWHAAELDLLKLAHKNDVPSVGICLGNQLLARALGGELGELDGGIECGYQQVQLTPPGRDDPLFTGIPWNSLQLHWHRFHVVTPPAGARVLAKSFRTPVQAWALGMRTYGIQFHPEAFENRAEQWADDEPTALQEAGLSMDELRAQTEQHFPVMARLSEKMFESIALLLMPLDRRFAGAKKIIQH